MEERYFVEYSVSQQCFHIDTINRTFETNINSIINDISNDYKVITIVDSYKEAQEYIRNFKKNLGQIVD